MKRTLRVGPNEGTQVRFAHSFREILLLVQSCGNWVTASALLDGNRDIGAYLLGVRLCSHEPIWPSTSLLSPGTAVCRCETHWPFSLSAPLPLPSPPSPPPSPPLPSPALPLLAPTPPTPSLWSPLLPTSSPRLLPVPAATGAAWEEGDGNEPDRVEIVELNASAIEAVFIG